LFAAAFAWCEYATRRHSGGQQGASKVPQTNALKSWQRFAAPRAAGRAPAGADCVARRQGGGAYSLLLSPLYCECGCSVCRGWRASSASLLNQQQCWALPWCGDCLQAGGQCCRHQTSTCCYLKSGAVSAFHSLAAQLCPLLAVDSRPSSVALRLYAVCSMVYRQRSSGAYCTCKAASSLYAASAVPLWAAQRTRQRGAALAGRAAGVRGGGRQPQQGQPEQPARQRQVAPAVHHELQHPGHQPAAVPAAGRRHLPDHRCAALARPPMLSTAAEAVSKRLHLLLMKRLCFLLHTLVRLGQWAGARAGLCACAEWWQVVCVPLQPTVLHPCRAPC